MQRNPLHPRYMNRDILYPNYLTGAKLTRWGKERDNQRQRVYDAEHSVHNMKPFNVQFSQRDLNRLADVVTSSDFWRNHHGPDHIKIVINPNRYASSSAFIDLCEIRLAPGWGTRIVVVLHELAHFLNPAPHAPHGPLFAHRFLQLVRIALGDYAFTLLRHAYQRHNVDYQPS